MRLAEDTTRFEPATLAVGGLLLLALQTQSYLVTIGVNDASGARIGEINTASNSLAAKQSVTMTGANAIGTVAGTAKPGLASCVVANVNRFPS